MAWYEYELSHTIFLWVRRCDRSCFFSPLYLMRVGLPAWLRWLFVSVPRSTLQRQRVYDVYHPRAAARAASVALLLPVASWSSGPSRSDDATHPCLAGPR